MATHYSFFHLNKGADLTDADLAMYNEEMKRLFTEFPQTCESLKDVLAKDYEKIYAVGIGDSLYSAESVKLAAWNNSGRTIEVLESYEFNYYYINYMPKNSLVIICSGGGQAARTVESCHLAQKRGATVVALTLSPHSRLSAAADRVLCFQPERKAYVDGACNVIALASMFHIFGIKLGLWSGHLSAADEAALYEKTLKYADVGFRAAMDKNNETIQDSMNRLAEEKHQKILFLGAGPGYILTELACAKFMEQAAFDAVHQQLEEYGHEQYWVHNRNGKNDFVVTICPAGKTQARAIENMREQKYLHCTTIAVTCDGYEEELGQLSDYVISAPEKIEDEYFWLAAANVLTRMANFYAANVGLSTSQFANDDQPAEHYRTIQFSRFSKEVEEFDIPMPDAEVLRKNGPHGLEFNKKKQ